MQMLDCILTKCLILYRFTLLLFTLSVFVNFGNTIFAQEKSRRVSVSAAPVLSFVSVKDKTFSQLTYSGIAKGASAFLSISRNHDKHLTGIDFETGPLTTVYSNAGNDSYTYMNSGYSYIRSIHTSSASPLQLKAGPAIGFFYSTRKYEGFINNNKGREMVLDLKAVADCSLRLKRRNDKSVIISTMLQLPVAAAVAQPVYGADAWQVPVSEKSEFSEVINNTRLLTLPAFLRVNNRLSMQYFFNQVHSISCSYFFDYLHIKDKREVCLNIHQIGVYYGYTF